MTGIYLSRAVALLAPLALVSALAGCGFDGVQSLSLPGTAGRGDDAVVVSVDLPDAGSVRTNGEVKWGEVVIGTVTELTVVDWHARATLSLEPDVELPANVIARTGVNSLLGAGYVELSPPADPQGVLASGDRIPLERAGSYPATEEVLASASVVLNGGSLEQLSTITHELADAFGDPRQSLERLVPRLTSFVSTLDDQRDAIVSTIRDLGALSETFAANDDTISAALQELAPALSTLADERPQITKALAALDALDEVATPLLAQSRADVVQTLTDLTPVIRALAASGRDLVPALSAVLTYPFVPEKVDRAVRGDYVNLYLTVDATNEALRNGLLGNPGLPGLLGLPAVPALPGLLGLPVQTLQSVEALLAGLLDPQEGTR